MLIRPINAIPAWEGYEYQGHIALNVLIKRLLQYVENKEHYNKCLIELEGIDDFVVKEGNKYTGIHQVKSSTTSLKKEDKFAFIISLLQYDIKYGYYHVAEGKNISTNFVETSKKEIDLLLVNLSKNIVLEKDIDEKQYKDYIVFEKIKHQSPKGSIYNILYYVLEHQKLDKSLEGVQKAVAFAKGRLKDYGEKLIKEEETLHDDSHFLKAHPEKFSNTFLVKRATNDIIMNIIRKIHPEWSIFADSDYCEFLYTQIISFVRDKITQANIDKQICIITFTEIFSIINFDYHSKGNSIDYQFYLVWKSIKESFEEYPSHEKTKCTSGSCAECVRDSSECNLYKQISQIVEFDEIKTKDFVYKILLQMPIDGKPQELPNKNLIIRLLLEVLKEAESVQLGENNILLSQYNKLLYRLSLDSSGEKSELQDKLFNESKTTEYDKLLIYETDVLITDQLDEETFFVNGINSMVMEEKEYEEIENLSSDSIENKRKRFTEPKIMRLLSRKNAIKELKND